jgi:predicted secreted Zn-dependent protease
VTSPFAWESCYATLLTVTARDPDDRPDRVFGGPLTTARIPGALLALVAITLSACATTQTPEQLRVEQAWAACQRDGRIPLQVRLTRIETNGRYWISGDAGTFGFQDTQACMSEKFQLPVVTGPIGEAVKVKLVRSTEYFSVRGDTGSEILASLEANSPKHESLPRAAGTTAASGKLSMECNPYLVTIDLNLVVTLPKHDHVDGLNAELRRRWERLVASISAHEERHVDIYVTGAQAVKRRIEAIAVSQPCGNIHDEIQKIWARQADATRAEQDKFDVDDAARVDLDRKPLGAQIDRNRARLAALDTDIHDLDRQGDGLREQHRAMQAKIDGVVGRMATANLAPASCSRARPGTPAAALCQEHRDLVEASNQLVGRYNGIVSSRNALVSQHEELSRLTNELVDAYNWTW